MALTIRRGVAGHDRPDSFPNEATKTAKGRLRLS